MSAKESKKNNFGFLKKFLFLAVVIGIVVVISYIGKYIYNKYLEYNNGKDEIKIYVNDDKMIYYEWFVLD